METPVEIDFQGIAANPNGRDTIAKHVSQLEERFGRITAGRVAATSTSGHKRTFPPQKVMSALPPKADMCGALAHVCFGPIADTAAHLESSKGGNAYLGHFALQMILRSA